MTIVMNADDHLSATHTSDSQREIHALTYAITADATIQIITNNSALLTVNRSFGKIDHVKCLHLREDSTLPPINTAPRSNII